MQNQQTDNNPATPTVNEGDAPEFGTPEQFAAIHDNVLRTSPNYFNISRPIRVNATLSVG